MQNFDTYYRFSFNDLLKCDLKENNPIALVVPKLNFLETSGNGLGYNIEENTFNSNLVINKFSNKKSVIIICSKDNSTILTYTLNKLKDSGDLDKHDILLVDDRSQDGKILELSKSFNTSYLRIDNEHNVFNYSVINNIAASYAKFYNKKLLIFYNNDLWPSSDKSLSNIIQKHHDYNSTLTGCKLVYPFQQDYENLGKPNHILGEYLYKIYNTIQHGGIFFGVKQASFIDNNRTYLSSDIVLAPFHSWRFYKQDEPLASFDTRCTAVTGALHIISTDKFIEIGGLNPSLSTSFQDIDICLRLANNKETITYVGTEYCYHAESITHFNEKITRTQKFISDNILWDYLYGLSLPSIIGFQNKI